MHNPAHMRLLRSCAALAYFVAMLIAGMWLWWSFRNQDTHATPPAIFIACLGASFVAGIVAWALAPTLLRAPENIWAVPLIVYASAAVVASLVYELSSPIIQGWPFRQHLPLAVRQLPNTAMAYVVFSALVAIPTLLAATILTHRIAQKKP